MIFISQHVCVTCMSVRVILATVFLFFTGKKYFFLKQTTLAHLSYTGKVPSEKSEEDSENQAACDSHYVNTEFI